MKLSLSFIALLLLMGGCSYFSDPGSEVILNVDNEFEIEMVEVLQHEARSLSIKITLLDQFNCEESELELNKNSSGDDLNIIIENIQVPQNCEDGTSYPKGTADFQVDNKNYNLGIQVQEQVNQNGLLQVSRKGYTLDLTKTKGLLIEHPIIYRIPDNFAWGYFNAKDESEVEIIETFLSDNNYSQRPLTYLFPGNYSYFNISDLGSISVKETPKTGIERHFALDFIDFDEIKEIVSNFKSAHPDVNIAFFGSDGSIF